MGWGVLPGNLPTARLLQEEAAGSTRVLIFASQPPGAGAQSAAGEQHKGAAGMQGRAFVHHSEVVVTIQDPAQPAQHRALAAALAAALRRGGVHAAG